jgi:drug/metabolite transporter (DMT)-like permease
VIGILNILIGILLIGNSLQYQNSSGQLSAGAFFLLAGIILYIYFSDEEKSQKFIHTIISVIRDK